MAVACVPMQAVLAMVTYVYLVQSMCGACVSCEKQLCVAGVAYIIMAYVAACGGADYNGVCVIFVMYVYRAAAYVAKINRNLSTGSNSNMWRGVVILKCTWRGNQQPMTNAFSSSVFNATVMSQRVIM